MIDECQNFLHLPYAVADMLADYLALYRTAAALCAGLDWTVLAAIGKVETDHGRSRAPGVHTGQNPSGAAGPMQFLAPTFASIVARHPLPPGGAHPPSRYNPHDAIHAAAFYLCDNGAAADLRRAVYAYNHDEGYVTRVLEQAARYADPAPAVSAAPCQALPTTDPVAFAAINYACGQLGLPYQWGGDGPASGDAGFDCSGLAHAAYAAAGITLPRTAHAQYHAGPPAPAPLHPGDLVFYGDPHTKIHHVGLYLGHGQMIHAPTYGTPVQIAPYRWPGDDYAGATRPANRGSSR